METLTTTQNLEIQLKNVKLGASFMHQETINFAADIYLNGKKIGFAFNDGQGGCTHCTPDGRENFAILNEVEKHYLAKPAVKYEDYGGGELKYSLDYFIDEEVGKLMDAREIAKVNKKIAKYMINHIVIGNEEKYKAGKLEEYRIVKYLYPIATIIEKAPTKLKEALVNHIAKLGKGEAILNPELQPMIKSL